MEYLSVAEVAKIYKVDIETVYRWLNKGIIKGTKIGGLWRIPNIKEA